MEELGAEPCDGSQVFQDPVLPVQLTFLLFTHSFSINLGCSFSDLALHFNPRFNESVIVCNSRCSNAWQAEHHDKHFCFSRGSTVKVRGLCQHGVVGSVCGGGRPRLPYSCTLIFPVPSNASCSFPAPPKPHPLGFWS